MTPNTSMTRCARPGLRPSSSHGRCLKPGLTVREVNPRAKEIGGASVRKDADLFIGLYIGYVRLPYAIGSSGTI
jgi:hypothetical protein